MHEYICALTHSSCIHDLCSFCSEICYLHKNDKFVCIFFFYRTNSFLVHGIGIIKYALVALSQYCHGIQVGCGLCHCSLSDRFVENGSRLLASAYSACIDLPTLALSSCTDMSTIASLTTLAAVATES